MKKVFLFMGLCCFMILPVPAGSADLISKETIIEELGGASSTKQVPAAGTRSITCRTRGLGDNIDRGIRVKKKDIDVVEVNKYVVLHLLFKLNSTDFADYRSYRQLEELGIALKSPELANIKIRIAGHTCDLGSDYHNLRLSESRAERVKNDLIYKYGISPSRMHAVGFGEQYADRPNTSEDNRRHNRRVVIERVD